MVDVVSRIFVGVKLPPSLTASLTEIQTTLRRKVIADLRWNDPNQFVLNMVPIGEIHSDKVPALAPLLDVGARGFGSMNLCLEGLFGLPNNVQPRYVCLNLTGDLERLRMLQASLQRHFAQVTGPVEGRGFEPHIVLGRLKKESEPERVALGRGLRLMQSVTAGSFTLNEVQLLRAVAADGVSYEVVRSFPLIG